jgi:catalase
MKLATLIIPLSVVVQCCLAQKDPVGDAYVVDAGTKETTQFGAKINNTDTLTVGKRGPTLLEDFQLREKIMHFGKSNNLLTGFLLKLHSIIM